MVVVKIPTKSIIVQKDEHGQSINPRGPVVDTTDLQQSITTVGGLLEPIVVRWMPGATQTAYYLVHGERRLTAVTALGWQDVDARILPHESTPEDDIMYMLAGDTSQSYPAIYLAKAFIRLRDAGKSMKEIADAWGKTPDQVSAHIQLLEAAPAAQEAVMAGRMGMSAFSLVKHLPPDEQAEIINQAGESVSMRYVKERMRQRRDVHAAANGQTAASPAVDRTVKGEYHKALTAVRAVRQAMQDGRLPASYDDWPADITVLHVELLAALDSIRPLAQPCASAQHRKPAPVFL